MRSSTLGIVLMLIGLLLLRGNWNNRLKQAELKVERLVSAQFREIRFAVSDLTADPVFSKKALDSALKQELDDEQRLKLLIARETLGEADESSIRSIVSMVELLPLEQADSVLNALNP